MTKYKIYEKHGSLVRVRNEVARKLYNAGYEVALMPCKLRFDNGWVSPFIIKDDNETFSHKINDFTYYNCNSETGYYPHYYVKTVDLQDFYKREEKRKSEMSDSEVKPTKE